LDAIKVVLYLSKPSWTMTYDLGFAVYYNKDPRIWFYLNISNHIGTAFIDDPDWSNIKL